MPSPLTDLVVALAIPPGARVDSRVPKKMLLEQGAPTAADRRAIQDGVDELHWVGALKPNTIGVRAFVDGDREYIEIAIITVRLRPGAKAARLMELIHRAIPYPVLLVAQDDRDVVISVAHKRSALNEAGKVVIDEVVAEAQPESPEDELHRAFRDSLAVAKQPARDLHALYDGWRVRVEALSAARITGTFAVPDDPAALQRRRTALDTHHRLGREMAQLRSRAGRAKQISQRVELNQTIKSLEAEMAACRAAMMGDNA